MAPNPNIPKLSTKFGLKSIAPLSTKRSWNFVEAPVDVRALDGLKHFNPKLHDEVSTWHRKHGRGPAIAKKINRFDRKYSSLSKLSQKHQHLWSRAVGNLDNLFQVPFKTSLQSLELYEPTKNSSSGYPRYEGRLDTLETCIDEGIGLMNSLNSNMEEGKSFRELNAPPVTIMLKSMPGPRLDEDGNDKYSTRGIWCYPSSVTAVESCFGTPLYKTLLKYADVCSFPIMHGPGAFSRARGFVGSIDIGQGLSIADHVSGDTQMPPFFIRAAFKFLRSILDFELLDDQHLTPEGQALYDYAWRFVVWYFVNTPLVFNDWLYRKSGGCPSGSLFTLLIWCIVSCICCTFVSLLVQNRMLTKKDLCVCGDDNGFRLFKTVSMEEVTKAYATIFIEIHPPPKSSVSYWPNCTKEYILSSNFSNPSRIQRDTVDMFSRCVYPSSWISCREESVARVLMISMSMLNTHPEVYAFARWYALWKPVYLKRVVKPDRDLAKYYYYVLGKSDYFGARGKTRLIDVMRPFSNLVEIFLQFLVT